MKWMEASERMNLSLLSMLKERKARGERWIDPRAVGARSLGSWPTMFITVALGAGIEKYIDTNENLSFFKIISSPEIYLPILAFLLMILVGFFIKKLFFKKN